MNSIQVVILGLNMAAKMESPGREGGTPGARTGSCYRSMTPSRELIVGPQVTQVN